MTVRSWLSHIVPGVVPFGLALALFAAPVPAGAATAERLISLDAEDAYLPSVLKILAEKGGLNIITGPGVTGDRISIHMRDVPVEQAVNLVVRAAGLAYERIGNSVLVADLKSLREETGLSSYVVELKYADAAEVKNALKQLTDKIEIDRGGNRLIVVTSPRVIAEIEEIVRVVDVPVQQVTLEARIVEVSTDAAKRLGIDWDLLNRQGVLIVEGQNPGSGETGSFPENLPFESIPSGRDATKLGAMSRQAKTFQIALDMLISDGNARVLANPKIATLNGREASMLIGSRIPFTVTGVVSGGGAGAGVATQKLVEREEVGIKLRITPTINPDGYITTVINPEVSSVTGFTGEFNDLPIVSTRQASTTVRLKDGNSVIIGGLLSEEKTSTVTKVPILGSIPGLGLLFQHHNITNKKTDLVIEVTPHIMVEQQ
jgi:type IV pilus secretin PilQ/predicted competence protein